MTFRARMLDEHFGVGAESLQVGLYEESEIPWDQIAFPSISFALRCYFEDRQRRRANRCISARSSGRSCTYAL